MFLSIIYVLTNLPIMLILYYFNRGEFRMRGAKKYALLVRLTDEIIADSEFSEIRNRYETSLRHIFYTSLLFLIGGIVLFHSPVTGYVSAVVIVMLLPMFYQIDRSHRLMFRCRRRLLSLKRKYGAYVEGGHIIYLDLVTSRLKNRHNPSASWFLIPLGISLAIPLWNLRMPMVILTISSCLTTTLAFFMFRMIARMPSKVYCSDSRTNLLLNQAYRRTWSSFFLSIAFFSAFFHILIASSFFQHLEAIGDILIGTFLIIIVLFSLLPILYALKSHQSLKSLEEKVLQSGSERIDLSDDEQYYVEDGFWGFQYNNPNNSSVLISAPTGLGQSINIGTKKGRIFYYGSKCIFYIVMMVSLSMTLFEDMTFPKMEVSGERIRIRQTLYPFDMKAEEIEKIEWTEEDFERGSLYKRVGTATVRILRGDFNLQGVGMVKVYTLKRENFPKIIFYLKDGEIERLYFSGANEEETRRLFEELARRLPEKTGGPTK